MMDSQGTSNKGEKRKGKICADYTTRKKMHMKEYSETIDVPNQETTTGGYSRPVDTMLEKKDNGKVKIYSDTKKLSQTKIKHKKPTHFIATKLHNDEITEKVRRLQADIVKDHPRLAGACVPIDKLHITLLVTTINDQEEVDRYMKVVNEASAEFFRALPRQLTYAGLGHFKQQVLFIEVKERDQLIRAQSILFERLLCDGVIPYDKINLFTPHLTVAKISRIKVKKSSKQNRWVNKIPLSVLEDYDGEVFGIDYPHTIDLLHISKTGEDGYYLKEWSMTGVPGTGDETELALATGEEPCISVIPGDASADGNGPSTIAGAVGPALTMDARVRTWLGAGSGDAGSGDAGTGDATTCQIDATHSTVSAVVRHGGGDGLPDMVQGVGSPHTEGTTARESSPLLAKAKNTSTVVKVGENDATNAGCLAQCVIS